MSDPQTKTTEPAGVADPSTWMHWMKDLNGDGQADLIHVDVKTRTVKVEFSKKDGYFPPVSQIDRGSVTKFKDLKFYGLSLAEFFKPQQQALASKAFSQATGIQGARLDLSQLQGLMFILLGSPSHWEIGLRFHGMVMIQGQEMTVPLIGDQIPTLAPSPYDRYPSSLDPSQMKLSPTPYEDENPPTPSESQNKYYPEDI